MNFYFASSENPGAWHRKIWTATPVTKDPRTSRPKVQLKLINATYSIPGTGICASLIHVGENAEAFTDNKAPLVRISACVRVLGRSSRICNQIICERVWVCTTGNTCFTILLTYDPHRLDPNRFYRHRGEPTGCCEIFSLHENSHTWNLYSHSAPCRFRSLRKKVCVADANVHAWLGKIAPRRC